MLDENVQVNASAEAEAPQVFVEGRSPRTWETAVTSDDTNIVVIDGCWSLPPRGR